MKSQTGLLPIPFISIFPSSAYTRNQMKDALEKGNGEKPRPLQNNIYIKALINARSPEIAAIAGERIEFTGVFTGGR